MQGGNNAARRGGPNNAAGKTVAGTNRSQPPRAASRAQALAVLVAGGLIVAALAAPYSGWWREARYRKMPPAALSREAIAHPGDPLLLFWHGQRLNEAGRYKEAGVVLEQAARLDPHAVRVRDAWAQAQMASGRAGEAFSQLKQFAALHPQNAQAHLLLGKLHVTLGAHRLAEASLKTATRLDPNRSEAWALLGDVYHHNARDDEAIAALRRAVRVEPDRAAAQVALGSLLASREPQAASQAFRRAVAREPNNAAFRREWADFLSAHGDRAEAEAQARVAVRLDPGDARAHLLLGRCLMERGALEQARGPLEQAAALAPFDPRPAQDLRRFYARTGDKASAAAWTRRYKQREAVSANGRRLRDALLRRPRNVDLNRKMARHQATIGDVEQCVHYLAIALNAPPDAPAVVAAAANELRAANHSDQARALERQMLPAAAAGAP